MFSNVSQIFVVLVRCLFYESKIGKQRIKLSLILQFWKCRGLSQEKKIPACKFRKRLVFLAMLNIMSHTTFDHPAQILSEMFPDT